MSATTHPATV